jgi:hypothetical protein
MALRKLEPDEPSRGVHNIEAIDTNGVVVARYECDCPWCDMWRAALPDIARSVQALKDARHDQPR